MNKEEVIPCVFYFYIHYKLKEKFNVETVLSIKETTSFLFEWRIPKEIRPIIIRELELLNLIERVGKKYIKINNSKFDIDDMREFCKAVELY